MLRKALTALLALGILLSGGCAGLPGRDSVDVILADVSSLPGQGLEMRMLVKLRVQNPNDQPIDYNGVSVQLDVEGKRFASGVSDARGTVPRFGEAIIAVPVSISVFRIARQAYGVLTNEYRGKLAYEMSGQLAGPAFNSMRFSSKGEFTLPADIVQ